MNALPENRRIVVADSLSRCDTVIEERVNEFASDMVVKTCKWCLSSTRGIAIEEPCYDSNSGIIYMDAHVDDDEYAEIFKHELGHYIDDRMGCPSCKEEFGFAIQADIDRFTSASIGISTLGEMLGELVESPAIENRYLSDIFSAMFHDVGTTRQRNAIATAYDTLGIPIYGHEVDYWLGQRGPKNAAQLEIFADVFAIYVENDLKTVHFIEKWLPNIANRFKIEIE